MSKIAVIASIMMGIPARLVGMIRPRTAAIALIAGLALIIPRTALAVDGPPGGLPIVTAVNNGTSGHYNINTNNYGLVAHKCADIGNYKNVHAIICADVYAWPEYGTKNVDVFGMMEGYCQGTGTLPECTEVYANYGLGVDGAGDAVQEGWCGVHVPAWGDCVNGGRNYFYYADPVQGAVTLNSHGQCHSFFGIAGGGYSIGNDTQVELPGDQWKSLLTMVDTPAAYVCDEM